MKELETKIDKIAEDTAYMRGQYDAIIPDMKLKVDKHENEIVKMKARVGMFGSMAGFLGGGVIEWLARHFHM